ncbi:MAG: hypothetical protein WCN88_03075 [Candidatus Falkowbacteria bacterium]
MKKLLAIFLLACTFGHYAKAETREVKINPNKVSFKVAETNGLLTKLAVFCTIKDGEQEKSSKFDPKTGTITYTGAASLRIDSILDTILIATRVNALLYENEIIDAYLGAGKPTPWTRPMSNAERTEHWTGTYANKEQLITTGTILFDQNLRFIILKTELVKTQETEVHTDIIVWLISVLLLPFVIWIAVKFEDYDEDEKIAAIKAKAKNKTRRFLSLGLFAIWSVVYRLIALMALIEVLAAFFGLFVLTISLNPLFIGSVIIVIIILVIQHQITKKPITIMLPWRKFKV